MLSLDQAPLVRSRSRYLRGMLAGVEVASEAVAAPLPTLLGEPTDRAARH